MNIYEILCERIWRGYKTYAKTCAVMRRGYELTNMCDTLSEPVDAPGSNSRVSEIFSRRGESVLEHQAKTVWLAVAFANNLQTYFGTSMMSESERASEFLTILSVALCHDVGETEIGDIPDDGSSRHESKNSAELNVFRRMLNAFGFPSAKSRELVGVFRSFQERDYFCGQGLYALDKAEAILTLLFLESYGKR